MSRRARTELSLPKILTDSEVNLIRGKATVGHATPAELMSAFSYFDLVIAKYREALETLSGCLPNKMHIYGAYGEMWSADEPSRDTTDEFEVVNFNELLGE